MCRASSGAPVDLGAWARAGKAVDSVKNAIPANAFLPNVMISPLPNAGVALKCASRPAKILDILAAVNRRFVRYNRRKGSAREAVDAEEESRIRGGHVRSADAVGLRGA